VEVLGGLVNAYYDLKDMPHYEHAARRLWQLERHEADLNYGLAGAYLVNDRPALALHMFREALRRWPDHSKAEEARKMLPLLEEVIREQTAELNLPEAEVFELIRQHDEVRYYLDHSEFKQGRLAAEKLLQRFPNFIPALNNLGQICAVEGDIDQAIKISLRVLQIEQENIHALSNLARLNFLRGRPEEALKYAEQLKLSKADATYRWTKTAEALTFLEDDAGVLALYEQAKAAGELEPPTTDSLFYHLLAVAAYNLGNEKKAIEFWEKALKIDPNFPYALENMADIKKPADERNGVWAFPFETWLLGPALLETGRYLEKMKKTSSKAEVQANFLRFLTEEHPEVFFLAPHLIARGDAKARGFVTTMAAVSGDVHLVEIAKNFVFGKKCSFEERINAAETLYTSDLLPSGAAKMWVKGKEQEILLLNVEIDPEPVKIKNMPRKAEELAEQALYALNEKDGERAQALLEQAINLWPNDPSLLNNLALAYQMQGQTRKAFETMHILRAKYPDYFFGIISAANMAALAGNFEQTHELLNGLMQHKKMHTSEFAALCSAQIQIALKEKNREGARSWVDTWERVDPDNPNLEIFRLKVESPGIRTLAETFGSMLRKR
jgi:tetratricopeptide (TPR) repeat protein